MNKTLNPISNAATFTPPADDFVHVQPYGEYGFTLPGGRKIKLVIDERAVDAQIASFKSSATSAGSAWAGLLCDFDHLSDDEGQRSEAAAWVTDLQKRADGLWAKMRFTDAGAAAVSGGRYRFTSNVHNPEDCVEFSDGRLRPMRVEKFALTNEPRMLKGAVRMQPISSRADSPAGAVAAKADPADHTTKPATGGGKKEDMDCRILLLKILGLPDTATDEELQAAAATFGTEEKNEKTADGAPAHEALTSRVTELEKDNAAMKSRAEAAEKLVAGQKADATLIALEGEGYKFTSRDEVKQRLVADHDGMVKTIRLQPVPAAGAGEALRSRKDAKNPDTAKLTPEAKQELRERLVDETQAKCKLRSRASAVARVQASRPDLWSKE